MKPALPIAGFFRKAFLGLAFLVLACHLGQDAKVENTLTFSQHFESLSQYDSLVIEVKDADGKLLAVVFQGKVKNSSQLEKLPVPGWDGGSIRIIITGFRTGRLEPIYLEEKRYDGTTRQTDAILVHIHPRTEITAPSLSVRVYEGQKVPLPQVDITPANLVDPTLSWSSDNPGVALVEDRNLVGVSQGTARLTARLVKDTTEALVFTVQVDPDPGAPTRLALDRDTLRLVRNGAPGRFGLELTPTTADPEVVWRISDTTIAALRPDGAFAGLQKGVTEVWVSSKRNPSAKDNGWIAVSEPVTDSTVVSIDAPGDNSHTNRRRIQVAWSVNEKPQDSLLTEDLAAVGPNLVVRSFRDSAGKLHSASITVHLDTTAPNKPTLSGASPTNATPQWNWSTGGGGTGDYRFRLGNADFPANAPSTRDTTYTLAETPVSGTTYTLYVQERDLAGNWSPVASLGILYDVTRPVVVISSPQASGTYYTTSSGIVLSGTASGPLPISRVTYRVGTGTATNATLSAKAWSTLSISLQEGVPVQVTVTAIDSAGNSGEAVLNLLLDNTPPAAPTLSTAPSAVTASLKGTFGWSPGGDGTSGSGLNGHYRYNLNGGLWKDTTATLLTDLPLVEGNNVFSVQAQDRAQLWSASATRAVRVDTTPPVITLSSHTNPVASASTLITLTGQVRDTGTGVAAMTVSGQTSGSPTVTVAGGNWSTSSLTLATGPNTLVFTATDQVGNSRLLNVVVNVNVAAARVIITNPSDSLTLTRLDTLRVSYTIDGIPGNKLFDLVEGVNRLEITSPPNASGNIGRDSVKVTMDATPPLSPTLTAGTTPTNASAIWTWTSRGDNANGAGVRSPARFRYAVNGGSFTETGATRLEIAEEGTYSLVVQEQDRAGNWSLNSAARSIVVDKTGPTIAIQTRNNYVTNRDRVYVHYTVNGVAAGPSVCLLSNANASRFCPVSATDNLGNTTKDSITVWYRPNTWFVTEGGNGPGTSWDSAASDLGPRVRSEAMVGKELWVATGNYPSIASSIAVTVVGGFNANSFPHTAANRNLAGTIVDDITVDFESDISIDGAVFGSIQVFIGKATLTNVTLNPRDSLSSLGISNFASLIANNLQITGKRFGSDMISIGANSVVTFNGGSVVNNYSAGTPISISGPDTKVTFTNGFNVYGNTSNTTPSEVIVSSDAQLTVDNNVNIECGEIQNDGGSVSCKGNPL